MPISFGNQLESGHEPLAGASPLAMNVVVDAKGAVRRRPGIEPYGTPNNVIDNHGILGLYVTTTGRLFVVGMPTPLCGIYEMNQARTHAHSLSGHKVALSAGKRPVFAETEALVVIAAGLEVVKIPLLDLPPRAAPLLGNPPRATHIVANNSRLLGNHVLEPNHIYYSDQASGSSVAGHETWGVTLNSGYFSADARPDAVVALHENTNEIFAFGSTNLQVFAADPQVTYANVTAHELGVQAPYSVIKFDQKFAFIDQYRRLVLTDGRQAQPISDPIKHTLDEMSDASDAFGYRVTLGNADCLVWTFPSDGRTFAYQTSAAGFSEWMGWDENRADFAPLNVTACVQRPDTGENIVGLVDGRLGIFKQSASTDLGEKIVAHVDTGFEDRKTSMRKWCKAVRLRLRRGYAVGNDATALLQWRDDNGAWESPRPIDLGGAGDRDPIITFRSLGHYRQRQWRFVFSGSDELVLADAEEEFELLAV